MRLVPADDERGVQMTEDEVRDAELARRRAWLLWPEQATKKSDWRLVQAYVVIVAGCIVLALLLWAA